MMARFVLTLLVGLVVLLGALVSGGSGVAWAGNWNLSKEDKAKRNAKTANEKVRFVSDNHLCTWAELDIHLDEYGYKIDDSIRAKEIERRSLNCFVKVDNARLCSSLTNPNFFGLRKKRYSAEIKRRNLNCNVEKANSDYVAANSIVDYASWSNDGVCKRATYQGRWEAREQFVAAVHEAKRRGLSCGVNNASEVKSAASNNALARVSSDTICLVAVFQGSWSKNNPEYVEEAKRRGLSCGVGETSSSTQIASVPNSMPQATSAALTAAQRKADAERQKRIQLEQELAALRAEKATQQQTISSDTKLPTITIASASSNGPQGTISGRVTDNTGIAEVRLDGRLVRTDANGNFSESTYVPEGGVSVSIQAVDLAGLSSSMSVRLDRRASTSTASISFERLNPLGRKVAKNKDALALIIGVDGYKSTPARAIYADSDAKVFTDYASQKLGIPTNRIKTLVNDGAGEREMLLSVKSWLSRASKQGKSDVYVFFAGHGLASDDGQKMYLLPYDGAPELLDDTAILRDRLFSDIASANPRSVTVFLDTCYSGTTRGTDMLIASRPIAIKLLEQSVPDNFTVMTAARGDQTAKPLEEAKHGMFSYFLMKGMEGEADENQDNKITAGELHQYVQSNVVQQSSGSQTPELQGDADRVLVRFQ